MRFLKSLSRYNLVFLIIILFPLDQLLTSLFPGISFSPFVIVSVVLGLLIFQYANIYFEKLKFIFQLFFVYCIFSFISVFWSDDEIKSVLYTLQLVLSLSFCIVAVAELSKDQYTLQKISFYGCVVGAIIAQMSLMGMFSEGELSVEHRITFSGIGLNAVAISIGFTFILGITGLFNKLITLEKRILLIISCSVIFYFLLRTGTRSSIFGVFLALGISYVLSYNLSFKNISVIIFLFLIMFFSFNYVLDNIIEGGLGEHIMSVGAKDIESNSRKRLWEIAFDWFSKNILGTGAGNEYVAYTNSSSKEAHNIFISALLQLGFVGFILILMIISRIAYLLFTIKNNLHKFTGLSLFVFLVLQMIKGSFLQNRIFWIPVTLIFSIYLLDKKNKKNI